MPALFMFIFVLWIICLLFMAAWWLIANVLWWAVPLCFACWKAWQVLADEINPWLNERALRKAEAQAAQDIRDEFEETKRWMRQSVADRRL